MSKRLLGEEMRKRRLLEELDESELLYASAIETIDTLTGERNLLNDKLEDVQEWAFQMECMYEDCTYLSHESFNKDARSHLKKLVELVGKWIPPEIRDSK